MENALNQIASRKYIVGTVDENGYFSLSSRPYFHATHAEALKECNRLACLQPGKAYIVMQLAGGALLPQTIGVLPL